LFPLLGLVPGPDITAEAAAALAGSTPAEARRGLETLAAAHLVSQPTLGRYQCHDLLRAYAENLAAPGDPQAVERLLDHYPPTAATAPTAWPCATPRWPPPGPPATRRARPPHTTCSA